MSSPSARTAREVTVHGVVQGVGFRFHCLDQAEQLGVTGWVRNQPDGTVAGHFEGPPEAVEALVAWCRHGPAYADVHRLDEHPAEPTGAARFTAG